MGKRVNLLSRYRTQLMGFAILLIVVYHSGFGTNWRVFNFLKTFMYFGVDILLFLSGYGVYFSLKKNQCISFYLRKRVTKILIPFLPILLIWIIAYLGITNPLSMLKVFIFNVTGLSFWLGMDECFNWYIGSILFFYLLSVPLFKIITNKNCNSFILFFLTILLGAFFIGDSRLIAISRLPIFTLGMIVADDRIFENFSFNAFNLLFLMLLGVTLIVTIYFIYPSLLAYVGLYWYPFLFIVPLVLLIVIKMLESKSILIQLLYFIFSTLGKASYSVFLVHNLLFMIIGKYQFNNSEWILIIVSTLLLALMYDKILDRIKVFR